MKLRALVLALSLSTIFTCSVSAQTVLTPEVQADLGVNVRPLPQPFAGSQVTSEFVQETLGKRLTAIGYTPTDPGYKMTIEGVAREVGRQAAKISVKQVASAIAGASAAAVVGITTAPAWLTIAAGIAGTVVVSLAADYVYDWVMGDDGDGDGLPDDVTTEETSVGDDGNVWLANCNDGGSAGLCGGSSEGAVMGRYVEHLQRNGGTVIDMEKSGNTWTSTVEAVGGALSTAVVTPYTSTSLAPTACDGGPFTARYGDISGPLLVRCDETRQSNSVPILPYDAAQTLPNSVLESPAAPKLMSEMLNGLWQEASLDPDYSGVPYSPGLGFTENELEGYRQQNPAGWPSVGDLVTPVNPGTITNPQPTPWPVENPGGGTPDPDPTTNINVEVVVDLDPGEFQPPGGLTPPTMESILAPLLGLFPGLRDFQLQGPAGECPTFEFDYYGHYVVDGHCQIMEDHRQLAGAIFLLLFTVAALRVVLSA